MSFFIFSIRLVGRSGPGLSRVEWNVVGPHDYEKGDFLLGQLKSLDLGSSPGVRTVSATNHRSFVAALSQEGQFQSDTG